MTVELTKLEIGRQKLVRRVIPVRIERPHRKLGLAVVEGVLGVGMNDIASKGYAEEQSYDYVGYLTFANLQLPVARAQNLATGLVFRFLQVLCA